MCSPPSKHNNVCPFKTSAVPHLFCASTFSSPARCGRAAATPHTPPGAGTLAAVATAALGGTATPRSDAHVVRDDVAGRHPGHFPRQLEGDLAIVGLAQQVFEVVAAEQPEDRRPHRQRRPVERERGARREIKLAAAAASAASGAVAKANPGLEFSGRMDEPHRKHDAPDVTPPRFDVREHRDDRLDASSGSSTNTPGSSSVMSSAGS